MPKFSHLHVHTEFSLLDGLGKIDEYIKLAKEYEMPGFAITDHGSMYGAIKFYHAAKYAGIKPLIGCEVYVAPRSRFLKEGAADKEPNHLLLIAINNEGYKNLSKIVSKSWIEGFYYKPRVDHELLAEHGRGIVATSGCLGSEVADLVVREKNIEKAKKVISDYQAIFGKENYYLEIQDHPEIAEQEEFNRVLILLSKELNIPLILTKDSHYAEKTDSVPQDALVCIQTNKQLSDKNRLSMSDTDLSFSSPDEMGKNFQEIPEALTNTFEIAERSEIDLDFKQWVFPDPMIKIHENTIVTGETSEPHLQESDNYQKILREIVFKRGKEKFGRDFNQIELERINYELDVIHEKGYDNYTLVVMDFVDFMKREGIPTTTRGSAAGSLASFVLGITTVNPLEFNLPFERYLNRMRPSAPDIDLDIADFAREKVINYAKEKYGKENVAQIITFGRMHAKAAIRDVGRVMGLQYGFVDRIAKMIPNLPPAAGRVTIGKAINLSNELQNEIKKDETVAKLIELAKKIEGTARHSSVHAAGIVITPKPLTEYLPLSVDSNGMTITQYEFPELEKIGIVKMDFLGLANLNTVATVLESVKARRSTDLTVDKIPLNDEKTFKMLARGDTYGVFQLESEGMRESIKKLKPTSVKDIAAMVALYRPGPMNFIDEFVKNKKNPEKIRYINDTFKEILKDSYGLIVYQDDVLYIALKVAGYNWLEADNFRKAMGKKIREEMEKQKETLVARLIQNGGITEKQADDLWHKIETFVGYGFNKSHAAAYGTLAYHTAYLKANFTPEYMAALLQSDVGNNEKMGETIKECKRLNIKVLAPDINQSFRKFTVVDDKTLRFGLEAVKNVGEGVVGQIIKERKQNGHFASIEDFAKRVDLQVLNKKTLEALFLSGAFDSLEKNRKKLLESVSKIQDFARIFQEEKNSSQTSLFGGDSAITISLKLDEVEDYSDEEKSRSERDLLGLYVSIHPLEKHQNLIEEKTLITPDQINSGMVGMDIDIIGVVGEISRKITKSGDYMAFFKLEGFVNQIECVAFPKNYEKIANLESASAIVIRGKVSVGRTAESLKAGSDEDELKIAINDVFKPEEIKETVNKKILEKIKPFKSKADNEEEADSADISSIENISEENNSFSSNEETKSDFEAFKEEQNLNELVERLNLNFGKQNISFYRSDKEICVDFSKAKLKRSDIEKVYNLINSQIYKIIT
jgi:DNA polymerase III subunit alpha